MSDRQLWLRFLGDGRASEARPRLCLANGDGEEELALKPRDRTFLAAIAVPRALANKRGEHAPELPALSAHEIGERTGKGRDLITRALDDLEEVLAAHGLTLEECFEVDRVNSEYGLRNVRVDFVELLAAHDDHAEVDRQLSTISERPASVGMAHDNEQLLNPQARSQLRQIVNEAQRRQDRRRADQREETPDGPAGDPPAPDEDDGQIADGPVGDPPALDEDDRQIAADDAAHPLRSRRTAVAGAALLIIALVVIAIVLLHDGGGHDSRAGVTPSQPGRYEITGGAARTWSNPQNAGGKAGLSLRAHQRVYVTCRIRGFQAENGNVWWYRLRAAPWSNHFYASADPFYNNNDPQGPLHGTPKVDKRIPICP